METLANALSDDIVAALGNTGLAGGECYYGSYLCFDEFSCRVFDCGLFGCNDVFSCTESYTGGGVCIDEYTPPPPGC